MGISPQELQLQRVNTLAFIGADSFRVTLVRQTATSDGAGGVLHGGDAPLAPQVMRLIPQQDGGAERMTTDGEMVEPQYVLMGRWDADILRGDYFLLDGERYEVVYVNQNTQYERKGEVFYRG